MSHKRAHSNTSVDTRSRKHQRMSTDNTSVDPPAAGFDIYPPLKYTKANQETYDRFLQDVRDHFALHSDSKDSEDSVESELALYSPNENLGFIQFKLLGASKPCIPRRCDHLLRFGSSLLAETDESDVINGWNTKKIIDTVHALAMDYNLFRNRLYQWERPIESPRRVDAIGCYHPSELGVAEKLFETQWHDEQYKIVLRDPAHSGSDSDQEQKAQPHKPGLFYLSEVGPWDDMNNDDPDTIHRGWYATEDIPRGTRIHSETALFTLTYDEDVCERLKRGKDITQIFHLDLETLELGSENEQEVLSFSTGGVAVSTEKPNEDEENDDDDEEEEKEERKIPHASEHHISAIFKTNAIPLYGEPTPTDGLFLRASRLNHSCVPNAQQTWDVERKRLHIHALQDIGEDEQITISYIPRSDTPLYPSREARKQFLWEHYRFECRCGMCHCDGSGVTGANVDDQDAADLRKLLAAPGAALEKADFRVNEVREVLGQDADGLIWSCKGARRRGGGGGLDGGVVMPRLRGGDDDDTSLARVHHLVQKLRDCAEEEWIAADDLRMADAYKLAYEIAVSVGDKARAAEFAKRVYAILRDLCGVDYHETLAWEEKRKFPIRDPLYATRLAYTMLGTDPETWEGLPPRRVLLEDSSIEDEEERREGQEERMEAWLWDTSCWSACQ